AAGRYGIILRVDHYNGLANDAKVSVALYDAVSVGDGGTPTQDGSDEWIIDDVSTEGPSGTVVPHFSDDNAYVTDGVLVAAFPRFELRASTPPDQQIMPFGLTALPLTAEMRGGEATRGILAGRMSLASLYNIASIRGICAGSSPVQNLIVTACQL